MSMVDRILLEGLLPPCNVKHLYNIHQDLEMIPFSLPCRPASTDLVQDAPLNVQ